MESSFARKGLAANDFSMRWQRCRHRVWVQFDL